MKTVVPTVGIWTHVGQSLKTKYNLKGQLMAHFDNCLISHTYDLQRENIGIMRLCRYYFERLKLNSLETRG